MTYERLSSQYEKTEVETSGKLDLVIICYEKAIHFLMQAKSDFEKNRIEQKARKMQMALAIINELQSCLNIEKGGQVAKNLDSIYTYLTQKLLLGDIKKDLTAFDDAIGILNELKGAWEEIALEEEDQISTVNVPNAIKPGVVQIAAQ